MLLGNLCEVEALDQLLDPGLALRLGQVEELGMQYQVLAYAQFAVQREALRHETYALAGGQVFGVNRITQQPGAALRGWHQAGQHFHGGGLAAAVRAQKAENLAPANGKADVVDRGEVAEFEGQVVGLNGDVAVVAGAWRYHQRFIVMSAVALVVGKGFIQLAGSGDGCQFPAQSGRNQLAAIQHQAVFELLGLFHVGRCDQQCELWALTAYVIHQLPETSP